MVKSVKWAPKYTAKKSINARVYVEIFDVLEALKGELTWPRFVALCALAYCERLLGGTGDARQLKRAEDAVQMLASFVEDG